MNLFRTKKTTPSSLSQLRPTLSTLDLILMGIGVIIGAGVFVLTGIAAATKAGPAITISYLLAGFAALFAAFSYAELAASIGGCGSAYNYTYAGFGEFIAWIIGWNLIFEYMLAVATIAIGWSGYANDILIALHLHLPYSLSHNFFEGGIVNLPAMLIISVITFILSIGTKQSARFNTFMVIIKLLTISLFIFVASHHINFSNWGNFFPFGTQGVIQGAALVFYAYIGFDALSTTAEETKNPQRSLPIGILFSVAICALIYVIVSGLMTLIAPYTTLNVNSPMADTLLHLGHTTFAGFISVGAIAGLTTGILVMYYGLTRITFAIARDGLLPHFFAKIHPKTRTPIHNILFYGVCIAIIAGLVPLSAAAELVNIGTLFAFTIVSAGVIVLRHRDPELHRPFRLPFSPLFPIISIILCLLLMVDLPKITWIRFLIWLLIGLIIYVSWGYRHSVLNKK